MKVAIRADALRLCLPCVSTEETRYYLHGINLEPHPEGGATAVATDGFKLGCAYDSQAIWLQADALLIKPSAKFANAMARRVADGDLRRFVVVQSNRLRVVLAPSAAATLNETKAYFDEGLGEHLIDASFVEWKHARVIPEENDLAAGSHCGLLSCNHIAKLAAGFAEVDRPLKRKAFADIKTEACMALFSNKDALGASVLRFWPTNQFDLPAFFAVLMPVRYPGLEDPGTREHSILPGWASQTLGRSHTRSRAA